MDGENKEPFLDYIGKLNKVKLICIALISEDHPIGTSLRGKKKRHECKLPLIIVDQFTLMCELGHIKKTEIYEYKGYLDFITPQTIEAHQR